MPVMSTFERWALALVVAAGLGCGKAKSPPPVEREAPTAGSAADQVVAREAAAAFEWPGVPDDAERVASIKFEVEVLPEEREFYPDGTSPYVGLDDPAGDLTRMRRGEEVVVRAPRAIVIIHYPLREPIQVPVVAVQPAGFTRGELAGLISREYRRIYAEEEASATQKTIPMDQRQGLINRNETDGRYGIWGHDLGDLDLHTIHVLRSRDGTTYLGLGIDS
jgi:hypothetical protein